MKISSLRDTHMLSGFTLRPLVFSVLAAVSLSACSGGGDSQLTAPDNTLVVGKTFASLSGNDSNAKSSPLLSLNPGGPGASPDQSLAAGDVLQGDASDQVLLGGLGVDALLGAGGADLIVGGGDRDRAFGGDNEDAFIWAPGDGSDFFDGGEGTDVIIFGFVGETRDKSGTTEGAPFFNISPPGGQTFADVHLNPQTRAPVVSVSGSSGFCPVVDKSSHREELEQLSLDYVVRFTLRTIADQFDSGQRTDDDGLRVAVSVKNTEFLVCAKRAVTEGGGEDNIEVLDLRGEVPVSATLEDLPAHIRAILI